MRNSTLKAVIIDDEPLAIRTLTDLIRFVDHGVEVIGEALGVHDGLELLANCEPDVIFLDIQMMDGTGFDLIRKLDDNRPEVVFTTAYEEHALEAFKVQAFSYLVKPIALSELRRVIEKLKNADPVNRAADMDSLERSITGQGERTFKVRSGSKLEFIEERDIIYASADGAYTLLHLANGKKVTAQLLKVVHDQLDSDVFVRVDRSKVINVNHVLKYERLAAGGLVTMNNGDSFKVSRRKRKSVEEAIGM